MSLPRAVLEAEQRADEILKQLNQAKNPQPQEGEAVASSQKPEDGQAQSVAVQAEPATNNDAQQAPPAEENQWEQRYKSLRGKYDAEVPRLAASNKELTTRLQSIEKELEDLRKAKATPRESLVKPEEVQEFGEPLVDLIRRAARDEVSDKEQEIASLRSRLERFEVSNTKNAEVDFYTRLAASVPGWEETNKEEGFLKWLAEYDELTGLQRQDSLDDAVRNNDAVRAARFFNKWRDINKQQTETSSRTLESQVVPTTSTVSTPPPGKKIWSRGEIGAFYQRAKNNEISDSDMVSIEADIHAAQLEGRIR